jgi:hypothetical protein
LGKRLLVQVQHYVIVAAHDQQGRSFNARSGLPPRETTALISIGRAAGACSKICDG